MVSRKKLLKEPDEFFTISGKLIEFGTRFRKELTIGAVVLLVLVAGISGLRYFNDKKELKGFAELNSVTTVYNQINSDQNDEKAYAAVKDDFEKLLDDFGSQTAGKIGRVIFAGICLDAGQYDQAEGLYQEALSHFGKDPFYGPVIQMNLGYIAVAKNDLDSAKGYFEAVTQIKEATVAAEALFNLATIYENKGDVEKARSLYNKIAVEYEQSLFGTIAANKANG